MTRHMWTYPCQYMSKQLSNASSTPPYPSLNMHQILGQLHPTAPRFNMSFHLSPFIYSTKNLQDAYNQSTEPSCTMQNQSMHVCYRQLTKSPHPNLNLPKTTTKNTLCLWTMIIPTLASSSATTQATRGCTYTLVQPTLS